MPESRALVRTCTAGALLIGVTAGSMSGCTSNRAPSAAGDAAVARSRDPEQGRLEQEIERYRQHVAAGIRESAAKDQEIALLEHEVSRLQLEVDVLQARVSEVIGPSGALPEPVSGQLARFAVLHGELMSFDVSRATLIMRSDAAFQRGTDTLTREAAQVLADLSELLNDASLIALDLNVMAHGDVKLVAGAEPTDALLRGTWELTNRQAAVVGAFMANTGVSADRLTVAGRGARHPRASNLTAAGRAENRRVEISLVERSDAPTQRHEPAQATADQAPID